MYYNTSLPNYSSPDKEKILAWVEWLPVTSRSSYSSFISPQAIGNYLYCTYLPPPHLPPTHTHTFPPLSLPPVVLLPSPINYPHPSPSPHSPTLSLPPTYIPVARPINILYYFVPSQFPLILHAAKPFRMGCGRATMMMMIFRVFCISQ